MRFHLNATNGQDLLLKRYARILQQGNKGARRRELWPTAVAREGTSASDCRSYGGPIDAILDATDSWRRGVPYGGV